MLSDKEKEIAGTIRKKILEELEYEGDVSDEKIEDMVSKALSDEMKNNFLPYHRRILLGQEIFNALRKLDILQGLIDNPAVTEIMVNGPTAIFVEENGRIRKLAQQFESEEKLKNIIQMVVAKCNRVVNDMSPIVDARLENGSRVNVVLNPVALNGPILTIRRFPEKPFDMQKLIKLGAISQEVSDFLEKLVIAGYNILVSGGTGSGKTTFLNALSGYIPKDERIITIEDSAELQLMGIDNLIRMETKNANTEMGRAITIRDLIKTSLRMRPDRIIVGEVRGEEAMDMICSAMNCGHDGSMSTVHSNSAEDTLLRVETMILMAAQIPVQAIRRQISSGVDIIVHLGRVRDKTRKVLEIVEITEMKGEHIIVNPLFKFQESGQSELGDVIGRLIKVGELRNVTKLRAAGLRITKSGNEASKNNI